MLIKSLLELALMLLNWYPCAGKSTILRLIFRFFDAHSGTVRSCTSLLCHCLQLYNFYHYVLTLIVIFPTEFFGPLFNDILLVKVT